MVNISSTYTCKMQTGRTFTTTTTNLPKHFFQIKVRRAGLVVKVFRVDRRAASHDLVGEHTQPLGFRLFTQQFLLQPGLFEPSGQPARHALGGVLQRPHCGVWVHVPLLQHTHCEMPGLFRAKGHVQRHLGVELVFAAAD